MATEMANSTPDSLELTWAPLIHTCRFFSQILCATHTPALKQEKVFRGKIDKLVSIVSKMYLSI